MHNHNPNIYNALKKAPLTNIIGPTGQNYPFREFSFGERGKLLDHELISEISTKLVNIISEKKINVDTIVTMEPGGHTWGMLVAFILKTNLAICRLDYNSNNSEHYIKTGYQKKNLDFSHLRKLGSFILLDDVISTGSTLRSILEYLKRTNQKPEMVAAICSKSDAHKSISIDYNLDVEILALHTEQK